MATRLEKQLQLRDGRQLAYAEYGLPDGKPIFLLHGMPASRLLHHPDSSILSQRRVRLIVPDRPGIGLSDHQPRRRLLDWPADLSELADALRLEGFAVLGISGGGPYTAACGYALDERVAAVGIASGVGPLDALGALDGMLSSNRMGYRVGRRMPWPVWRVVFRLTYGGFREHPEKLARMSDEEPEADHAVFAQPGVRHMFVEAFREAFRQGTSGVARDGWLMTRRWGFDLEQIPVAVHLWQGEKDVVVTPAMARYVARQIPNCRARFLPGEGHLIWITHWSEILGTLTDAL